MDLVSAQFN